MLTAQVFCVNFRSLVLNDSAITLKFICLCLATRPPFDSNDHPQLCVIIAACSCLSDRSETQFLATKSQPNKQYRRQHDEFK